MGDAGPDRTARRRIAAGEQHRASYDMDEGLAAFAEKRASRFEGR